jgi:hypothetical protein
MENTTQPTEQNEPSSLKHELLKHTLGPWSVMTRDEWTEAGGLQPSSVCHVGDFTIVTGYMTYDFHGDDEADARLIAAAPDMLAALQEIADGLADTRSTPGQYMTLIPKARACEIARAAIAKATGNI